MCQLQDITERKLLESKATVLQASCHNYPEQPRGHGVRVAKSAVDRQRRLAERGASVDVSSSAGESA